MCAQGVCIGRVHRDLGGREELFQARVVIAGAPRDHSWYHHTLPQYGSALNPENGLCAEFVAN